MKNERILGINNECFEFLRNKLRMPSIKRPSAKTQIEFHSNGLNPNLTNKKKKKKSEGKKSCLILYFYLNAIEVNIGVLKLKIVLKLKS